MAAYLRTKHLILILITTLLAASVVSETKPVHAYTVGNLTQIPVDFIKYYNWDFWTTIDDSSHVDNPINLFFKHNGTHANVDSVLWYSNYNTGSFACGYERFYNINTGWLPWSNCQQGRKTTSGCTADYHVRWYGANWYSTTYGYFSAASSHMDIYDPCPPYAAEYGYQEEAEHHVAGELYYYAGCNVFAPPCVNSPSYDYMYWNNSEQNWPNGCYYSTQAYAGIQADSSHCLESDAYATVLYVN